MSFAFFSLGQSWRKVGRNLGFTTEQIQELEASLGKLGQEEIAWRLIEKWTEETEDESLLLGRFITALRDAEIDTAVGKCEFCLLCDSLTSKGAQRSTQPYVKGNFAY